MTMRKKDSASVCDLCLEFIAGVCTDEERLAFERHLPGCKACQAEMDELRLVWEALPADMERIEPPDDLKKQVMDAAIAADKAQTAKAAVPFKFNNGKRRALLPAAAALFLLLFSVGTAWNIWLYRERVSAPLPVEEALSVPAAQIEQVVSLKPLPETNVKGYGVACIVDNGQSRQFVVYVFGAAPTTGDEAYQVWLIKDGIRKSAGTFRVAAGGKGIGVLAMPIASERLVFDDVGITLEPDDHGDKPRGRKMFGSA
jgi:hypothetical protein